MATWWSTFAPKCPAGHLRTTFSRCPAGHLVTFEYQIAQLITCVTKNPRIGPSMYQLIPSGQRKLGQDYLSPDCFPVSWGTQIPCPSMYQMCPGVLQLPSVPCFWLPYYPEAKHPKEAGFPSVSNVPPSLKFIILRGACPVLLYVMSSGQRGVQSSSLLCSLLLPENHSSKVKLACSPSGRSQKHQN